VDEVYEYLGQTFEWDQMKAARNAILHHVRVPEAASVSMIMPGLSEIRSL